LAHSLIRRYAPAVVIVSTSGVQPAALGCGFLVDPARAAARDVEVVVGTLRATPSAAAKLG
jgi:hypothetical protein